MNSPVHIPTITVALIGNPNVGKSTLFGALVGVRQRVGNYPGVTVEKKSGHFVHAGGHYEVIDLPGTYSLAPRSPDEMVAVDVLLARRGDTPPIDAVISIVDASNLERNLYVVSQVLALGRPTVLAVNMLDVARARGISLDLPRLEKSLGIPVVGLEAHRRVGIDELKHALECAVQEPAPQQESPFPAEFSQEIDALADAVTQENAATAIAAAAAEREHHSLEQQTNHDGAALPRYLVERLMLDTSGYLATALGFDDSRQIQSRLRDARQRLTAAGMPVPAVEAVSRYAWVGRMLEGCVTRPAAHAETLSDRLDRLLTHRWWGSLMFVALMIVMFQSVFTWASPLMDAVDGAVGFVGAEVERLLPEGALRSLLVDGVVAGVGGVLVFLPQIFILFFFIALLEDCGYMARAAYLMDKLMARVGLSGKSFIPLLSSFACAVPGIMATRVIENRRDRLTTILVAPLMSCSARLPVYTILIAAFIPQRAVFGLGLQGLTLAAMYAVGMIVAVAVALVLKRSVLRGETPPFVMELPPYKVPSPVTVLHRMAERGWAFVRRAGTLIFAVSIVVWAALYYPHPDEIEAAYRPQRAQLAARLKRVDMSLMMGSPDGEQMVAATADEAAQLEDELSAIDAQIAGAYQRQSLLGRAGKWVEPVVRPLGWDWRIGCAAIASFPAREVVVATLGVIYNLGSDVDLAAEEDRTRLQRALRRATWDGTERPVYSIPVALSIMVFFALCAQCAATLAVIRRETNSWRWPLFAFTYMTVLAYLGALITYQVGIRLSG
ncbi:MAG: ferrous iron transport protein B [Pirellulales bacterium]|nr:ferrous iron transport protein B [Pirellulales bacterium]